MSPAPKSAGAGEKKKMEIGTHQVKKIIVGSISESDSMVRHFYTRHMVIVTHDGQELTLTMFAENPDELKFIQKNKSYVSPRDAR